MVPAKRPVRPPGRSSADASPEERARAAIAKEEALPGDKVRLTFRACACSPRRGGPQCSRDSRRAERGERRRGPPGRFGQGPGQVVIAWPTEAEVEAAKRRHG